MKREVAQETLAILERGSYVTPSGKTVDIRAAVDRAVRGTVLYGPGAIEVRAPDSPQGNGMLRVQVTGETTAAAARRLVEQEGERHVVALNFASARNPGGGFLSGAKAQEEDLARCSALYSCQLTQPAYYNENRADGSMLYTDNIIYSPEVPFFRDETLRLLEAPFCVSIITAPAPNAGEAEQREEGPLVRATLDARTGKVLAVAQAQGHRTLVLGAWGCGVFRNDPGTVAELFSKWLGHEHLRGAFDRVVFAVYDRSKGKPNLTAFRTVFDPHGSEASV